MHVTSQSVNNYKNNKYTGSSRADPLILSRQLPTICGTLRRILAHSVQRPRFLNNLKNENAF